MILSLPEYDVEFKFEENVVNVFVVERPIIFSACVESLWKQCNGEPGEFVLHENEKEINWEKKTTCIVNPFLLDFNDKKIVNRLYQEVKQYSDDLLYEETNKLQNIILNYLEKLSEIVPYSIGHNFDMDYSGLLKLFSVHLSIDDETLSSRIVEYLKICHSLCGIETFFFVNIKAYLSEMELDEVYKYAFYEKVNVFLIESTVHKRKANENTVILDEDCCIISLN